MTITVTNSASITVPADSFGPGKVVGPNAVDAFAAAWRGADPSGGVDHTDISVGIVGGNAAAKKYAEEHLPQLKQNNAAAVHVPKVETTSKPKTAVKVVSKPTHEQELERLHWHMHNSVKESGIGVRAATKAAIGAAVATKEQEHMEEQEAAMAGRQASADLVNTAFKRSGTTKEVTEVKEGKAKKVATTERKETWAEVSKREAEEERQREVQMASMTAEAGPLEPPTEGA